VRAAADQMGVPPTTLTRFEKNDGTPHLDTLIAILRWIVAAPNSIEEVRGDRH
jgi:transcriptional regulator with XRE-family HTH domain